MVAFNNIGISQAMEQRRPPMTSSMYTSQPLLFPPQLFGIGAFSSYGENAPKREALLIPQPSRLELWGMYKIKS